MSNNIEHSWKEVMIIYPGAICAEKDSEVIDDNFSPEEFVKTLKGAIQFYVIETKISIPEFGRPIETFKQIGPTYFVGGVLLEKDETSGIARQNCISNKWWGMHRANNGWGSEIRYNDHVILLDEYGNRVSEIKNGIKLN